MNPTTLNRTVRELDCRTNDHIEVRLLWNSLTDSVSVSVHDTRYGESFQFDVAPAHALEAFRHPFAYAGNRRRRSRKNPLATEPEHWTYALGALSGVTVDARSADQHVHLAAQRALADRLGVGVRQLGLF